MEEKNKDAVITSYPEGLEYLAEHLRLPLPPALADNMEARKNFVFNLIGTLVRQ
ncbi:MAG: hypothetical protein HDT14_07990 [Oscillibacter sp.]|nr:hypothetical protein [Oscillibacter sp.]